VALNPGEAAHEALRKVGHDPEQAFSIHHIVKHTAPKKNVKEK
jgi:hypothetical protein